MDPASLAIGVATLVETAAKLIEILHDIREGGKQRIRLIAEISSLWLVLENVKAQLDELLPSTAQVPTAYLTKLNLPNGPLAQCSELLKILYEKCKPKKGAERVLQSLQWSFDKDEVDRHLNMLHRLQNSINLAYAQTSLSLLNSVATDTSATRRVLESNELQKLMQWLSPIDFEAQQRQAFSEWCPGTVQWVLETNVYTIFKRGDNPYLWCPAAPGCGKTVLSSLVVNDLRTFASASKNTAVLGAYLTSRSTGHDDATFVEVLGSLIKQLCTAGAGPDERLWDAFHSATKSNSTLSIEDAISHLKRLLTPFSRTFVVIDAIDELRPHKRRIKLIEHIKSLTSPLSIWLSGRPYNELFTLCAPLNHECDICDGKNHAQYYHCEQHLSGGWDICPSCYASGNTHCPDFHHPSPQLLASAMVIPYRPYSEDISLYARTRIGNDERLDALLGNKESLREQVMDKIIFEANDRFLTAKLFLNHLAALERTKDVKEALKSPLGNLDETYKQAFEALMKQRPDRVRMALEVLKWVVFSLQSIQAAELEQAIQFVIDGDLFEEDDVVPIQRLLEFASGFVNISYDGRVEFIHFTADEFVSKIVREQFPEGSIEISSTCLKFLLRENFGKDWSLGGASSLLALQKRFPFYSFAVRSWSHHIPDRGNNTSHDLAFSFLRSKTHVATASFCLSAATPHSFGMTRERPSTALHMAARFNLESLVLGLLAEHVYTDVNAQDHEGSTPLLLCARNGRLKAVCSLLDAGASPDIADITGWTPLLVAISTFYNNVVQTLINHPSRSANVNLTSSGTGFPMGAVSPVMIAALFDNSLAMKFLLEKEDLLVNEEYNGITALHSCAAKGNIRTARKLLEHGACNVNHVCSGTSALHAASMEGHTEMIELLLSHGAEIDLLDGGGGSPLLQAIRHNCYEAVWTLLKRGASLQIRDKKGSGVLHYAACVDNTEIFKLLLFHNQLQSSIDLQDDMGDTALHIALRLGQPQYISILRDLQASVDIANVNGETAREIAQRRVTDLVWMADVLLLKPKQLGKEPGVVDGWGEKS